MTPAHRASSRAGPYGNRLEPDSRRSCRAESPPLDGRLTRPVLRARPRLSAGVQNACTRVVGEGDAGLTTEVSVGPRLPDVEKTGHEEASSTGRTSRASRYLLPALLLVFSGLAWTAVAYTSHLPRTDALGGGILYMWWRLSGNDWLGVALMSASGSSLALLTWLLRFAVDKIVSAGWWALATGTASLVWLAGAAVASVIALLGFFTYGAGNETLVEGPHGVRRVLTQSFLSDSVDVYRPMSSHLYVFEPGTDNGLRHRLEEGRCTISEDQPPRLVLHCGDTATTLV